MNLTSAKQRDAEDPLRKYRKGFYPLKHAIYMDGNSLGLMSKKAEKRTLELMHSWRELGIEGWTKGNHAWFYLPEKIGEMMAPLVGGQKNEVIATGSTTTNLHQILSTFYTPVGKRVKIVADELTFPSDIYAIKSQLKLHGRNPNKDLVLVKSEDGFSLNEEDIIASFNDQVAMVILPVVLYRSGQLLPVRRITEAAHKHGIFVCFDAAHSVGAVPHSFHRDNVDAAFWCTYKYLNGGPGSVGGLFIHQKHFGGNPGLAGWFSSQKNKQFDMSLELSPAADAGAYQIGTPHILSLAGLHGSLELFQEVGMAALRKKSLLLTNYLRELIEEELSSLGVAVITPKKEADRGGHIAITHPEATRIALALRHHGVIPDFRPPNIIRLAPIAFYTSFEEVYRAVQILKKIIVNKEYVNEAAKRDLVS